MIKFFRKIRQKLVIENRFNKYLLYAIGEIILVVIGILIALQINNWNEFRKDRIIERKILKEVLLDMEINKSDIEYSLLNVQEPRLRKIKILNDHLIYKKPQYDSIGQHIIEASSTHQFQPRIVGYTSLNAKGVDVIRNENLRNFILKIYGLDYQKLIMEGKDFEQFHNPTKDVYPFIRKHLVADTNKKVAVTSKDVNFKFEGYGVKVKDYETLLNDSEFVLILQKSMLDRANKIIIAKKIVVQIDKAIESIKKELQS